MRFINRRFGSFLVLTCTCLLPLAVFAKPEWESIPVEDLAATECKSYPGASAEALIVRQSFESSGSNSWTNHFQRYKIYSPKAAEERGVMNIDYSEYTRVWNLDARVTKPDGHSTEYHKADFHDSVFVKVGGYKLKRQTLAVPNLEAGDVVELKWTQEAATNIGNYYWWYAQLPVPVRRYTFAIESSIHDCKVLWFNVPGAELTHPSGGQLQLEMRNLPPFTAETAMAPERDVRGWYLLMFTSKYLNWFNKDQQGLWKEISAYFGEEYRFLIKPNDAIKTTAKDLVAGAATDEEKLQRLYNFCQTRVSNLDYFDSAELQKAKKKLDDRSSPQSPAETLRLQSGYTHHVNELFASLAKAAGFDVRQAKSASREVTLAVKNPLGWLFLDEDAVAVHEGQTWKLYAPGDYYVPPGMLNKSIESATSLVCDEDTVIFIDNPVSPAAKSPVTKRGHFTLDAEGNLEGDVEISLEGHSAIEKKKHWQTSQQADIDADYRKLVTDRLPAAEISDLSWENTQGNKMPLKVRHKIKIPGYADMAGSKIILNPSVFKRGEAPFFTSEKHEYPIFFDHTWNEHDEVEIILPEGYMLDGATAPTNVGDPAGALGVRYGIGYKPKARTLIYKRDFALGANSAVAFQSASYPALKKLFDSITQSDEHTIVLKPKPEPVAPAAAPAPNAEPAK